MLNQRGKATVCHLSSAHNWYDERIFQKQAKSLAQAGYRVCFIVPRDRSVEVDGVRIVAVPQARGRLHRFLVTHPCLLRAALREHALVYHFHDPELILVGLCLRVFGNRVIYDVHEDYEQILSGAVWMPRPIRRLISIFWRFFECIAARAFNAIIVVDSQIREKFPPGKTEMITNPPPLAFVRDKPKLERSGPLKLIYLGAIAERRGVLKIIEALPFLTNGDVELHVIGAVNDVRLQSLFSRDPRIICHGRLPWNETRATIAKGDVGLMLFQPTPAHMSFTGEGNTKLFEFMALGIPVLFSNLPRLRAFIDSIGAGLAVDATNPREIAAAIDYLHENPELCHRLGENGRQAVRERFHWEKEEAKLLALYSRVAGSR